MVEIILWNVCMVRREEKRAKKSNWRNKHKIFWGDRNRKVSEKKAKPSEESSR